uniref:PRT_C domain-containing protein n=1 Tax=Macrostomum lignano TaxID=282301 RepID=A0A1I8F750_9PLAT
MSKFVKVYGFLQSVFQDVVKEPGPTYLTGFILAVLPVALLWVLLLRWLVLVFCVVTSLYIGSMGKPEMRSATAIDSLNTSGMSEAEAKGQIDSVPQPADACNPNVLKAQFVVSSKYGDDG